MMRVMQQQQIDGVTRLSTSRYRYIKYDATQGLHVFREEGSPNAELFVSRRTAPAGWCLKRGGYYYEFVSSLAADAEL